MDNNNKRKNNTRIYNFISVPKIALILLGDSIIWSKSDPHNGSKKGKGSYGKVKNNKTMLKKLSSTQTFYL